MDVVFYSINWSLTRGFAPELLNRMLALRWYWLTSADKAWNLFDAMLLFTALLQEVLNGMNLSILRIFRILRVARVARVVRVVRFFTQLLRMLLSILPARPHCAGLSCSWS